MNLHDLGPAAETPAAAGTPMVRAASIRLGGWSFYFLAKFILFWRELIGFHPLENLAFAAFLLAPVTSPALRKLRNVLAIPVAVALLYHDSWLPPLDRVLSQASLLSNFSLAYLIELAGRFVDLPVVAMLVIGWAGYRLAARVIRVGVIVLVVLIGLAIGMRNGEQVAGAAATAASGAAPAMSGMPGGDPDQALRDFFSSEAQVRVSFPSAQNAKPFDIIFIHVCSLSWDDVQVAGLDKHPLWAGFDFLFSRFNTAASYSGPAAVRINRATCGQVSHDALFDPVAEQCYLLPSLKQAGFETNLAFNHDGHFDDFLTLVRKQGVTAPLLPLDGLAVPLRSFDNSPIYDDFGVLTRWLDNRHKSDDTRVALFYNTISLHDGNRIVVGADARLSSKDNYRPRAEKLLNDLVGFMDRLEKSGRRAVVVMVPEHGAALRGDKYQIAGLREIPTPAITLVPVGVRVIGSDLHRKGSGTRINEPAGYTALSQLVARLIETSPFGDDGFTPADYATELPVTEYVAENEGVTMMRLNNRYWLRQGKDGWKEYPAGS